MGLKSALSRPFASWVVREQNRWARNPVETQEKVFRYLIEKGRNTQFGADHDFSGIRSYSDFRERVPVRDYEDLSPYITKIVNGEQDILWTGKPAYLAKTSGTTSGAKYIPITRDSVPNHINSARNALLNYIHEKGSGEFVNGKLIFLSGSPVLEQKGGINMGRLSGLVNHHVPAYLRRNQLPSYETNCIEDWEEKVERIIDETIDQNMTLISGIPPWVQMYFDRIMERTGKSISEVFPNFSLFVYGGVNFEPYRARLRESIGKDIDSVETYPASEGFIAYQDSQTEEGLLLLLNSGIMFEFIPAEEFFDENPTRIMIEDVELGKNYAIIINSNAGLWGYSLGDTVQFVSKDPYRLLVTGRIKHFISAFGEHVIGQEVEKAMKYAMQRQQETELVEFTVAPNVNPEDGLPHHEWYVEFSNPPADLAAFEQDLDKKMQELNPYYDDLITGKILRPLKVINLSDESFIRYMKSQGKLGGQNKVPRLSNDRKIADQLKDYIKAEI